MPYKDKKSPQARARDARFRAKHLMRLREAGREYYRQHPHKAKARIAARNATLRELIRAHKESHPCIDCGESNPLLLEFDHRDRNTKKFAVGQVTRSPVSIAVLKEEIAKCDMRCVSCHRKKTASERHLWSAPRREPQSEREETSSQLVLFEQI